MTSLSLPDKVPDGCHTLFVGVNPGIRSARISHYYAGHTNMFWKLLYNSGIWPTPITTEEDDLIVGKGFGLTDVAKRPTPGVNGLRKTDFAASKERIKAIVAEVKPRTVVFVSKTAVRNFLGNQNYVVNYGLQDWKIGESDVFLVPSTSGASQGDTTYDEKLEVFKELKAHITPYYRALRKARPK